MAGYSGYSMSNNAVDAYESGEKPRSKWTKAAILNAIEAEVLNGTLSLQCNIEKLKQAPLFFLADKGSAVCVMAPYEQVFQRNRLLLFRY